MEIIDILKSEVKKYDLNIDLLEISPKKIVFEERVKVLCYHCKNYYVKFTCPYKIPNLNYEKIINEEYENAAIVYKNFIYEQTEFDELRSSSTLLIHKTLLNLEKELFRNGCSTPLGLIGGSCKLCKTGCPEDKCNDPYRARIPMEATGINVVSTVAKLGIEIKFPVAGNLYRCGLILW